MSSGKARLARDILGQLRRLANPLNVQGMARYGITPADPLGISVATLRSLARELEPDHSVALLLWKSGIHEARILASILADPERMTERQMEAWVKDFDSWDICDQCCANLFEKTSLAWKKCRQWSRRKEEFVKRAGFTLIARLAVSDKTAEDKRFIAFLPLIRKGANDERNYVRKAVSWALRQIGKRNLSLHREAVRIARSLAQSKQGGERWVGRDALKELTNPKTIRQPKNRNRKKR